MEPVIAWAIGIGSCIFGLGMISAIGSRRQRKLKPSSQVVPQESAKGTTKKNEMGNAGIGMAAGGTGNVTVKEEELASISGSSS